MSVHQTTETLDPKKLEFPQDSHAERRRQMGACFQPWLGLVFQENISHSSDSLAVETMIGQWVEPHLDQGCLVILW